MKITAPTALTELCKELRLPCVAREAARLASECDRQNRDSLQFLSELLQLEVSQRRQRRATKRLREAGFPISKTLASFDFSRTVTVSEGALRRLSEGQYISNGEPVILLGEPGTGKTHLATALGVAAAEQGRKVRFVTAARLATELIEARNDLELNRVVARYAKVELLVLDELGYLPLSESDSELLFRVLSERHERKSTIVTTNLPFSEWTSVFPDPRLCRALVDRLTHRAHIIETGSQSQRLSESLKGGRKKRKK